MGNGQIDDEFHTQQRDLTGADLNVFLRQFGHYFSFVAMAQEESLCRMDHNVVAEVGARRHQGAQFLRAIGMATLPADHEHFSRPNPTHVQRADCPDPCFADF